MFESSDPVYECVFYLDFSCKFLKLQYNSLAFVGDLKRATDEVSIPDIARYSPYYLPLNVFTASKGSNIYILFLILSCYLNPIVDIKKKILREHRVS